MFLNGRLGDMLFNGRLGAGEMFLNGRLGVDAP